MIATAEALQRYVDAVLVECLALGEGDILFLNAEPAHAELLHALCATAHRLGADVDVQLEDRLVRRARLEHAPESQLGRVAPWEQRRLRATIGERAAFLWIGSPEHPDAYDGVPAQRVAADVQGRSRVLRWWSRATLDGRVRWSICLWPTVRWAAQVYPDLPADEAMRRLLDDILAFCRVGPADAPGAWTAHLDTLERRANELTARDLRRLELRAPGTHLDLALVPGTRFASGRSTTAYGQVVAVNFPSEEVFTSPDAAPSEGTFRCTRPLNLSGRTITGIAGELRRGRLVRLEADEEPGRDMLAGILDADRGARRLGEVALVDRSSRIGQAGRTYWNTGLDENATAHIAFGAGFPFTRVPLDGARGRRGVNSSLVHVDVMIGTDDLEVTAVTAGGERLPLIADGLWQI
jgi:aminopeptidase